MKIVYLFVLILSIVSFSGCGFEVVDTGNRGILTHFGKVKGESLDEGLHWYNPLSNDITEMSVRVETFQPVLKTYTKDIQQSTIKVALMCSLQKDKVHLVFPEYGHDWKEKILIPAIEGAVKTVIGKWDADDLIANRDKAREDIETMLKQSLAQKHVELIRFELTDIDYQREFEDSILHKVVAIQRAIESQNKTKQIEEEAKQRIITAESEAKSMKIRSDALSQNKALIEYEAVQKWNGQLPQYMLGNSIPFIQLSKDSK